MEATRLNVSLMSGLEKNSYVKMSPLDCKLISMQLCREVPALSANADALRACELIVNLDNIFKINTDGRTVTVDARMFVCAVTLARAAREKAE